MSAINKRGTSARPAERRAPTPRADDPRVLRSRAAVVEAARTLFLRDGYAGTTMEQIAEQAGLTKRTVYNNYADKDALFVQIVVDVIAYAEEFAHGLREELAAAVAAGITAESLRDTLHDLGRRLALTIVREEVVALRRLLIGEARAFPELAREYFDCAPGQVIEALAGGFRQLETAGLLHLADVHGAAAKSAAAKRAAAKTAVAKPAGAKTAVAKTAGAMAASAPTASARTAAAQFAYLVAGPPLDRAMLVGTTPSRQQLIAGAYEGVETFLARYAAS